MKTAVFYEHILEGAKQSGKSVAELMEKCASWNIRGIEIGDALLRENKEEIKELAYKCSFMNTRTIGQFKVLTIEDMENIYRAAK